MDGSRKLTVAFGAIAVISTSIAIALALRTPPAAPKGPGIPGAPVADEAPPNPRAPGGINAIAAKALEEGGPRTQTAAPAAGGPRRVVTSFRAPVDAAAPGAAWGCIAAAGTLGLGRLDAGGTVDGMADPTVAAGCTGAGSATLEGFVRLAVAPTRVAGETTCEATVSYTLGGAAADPAAVRREVRGERTAGKAPDNCAAALVALEPLFRKRVTEP